MKVVISKTEITCDACGVNLTQAGDSPRALSVGKIDLCSMCVNEIISKRNGRGSGIIHEAVSSSEKREDFPFGEPDKDSWGK